MKFRRILSFGITSLTVVMALALGTNLIRLWVWQLHASAGQRVPFTATLDQTIFYANGESKHVNTVLYAVRSDGAMVARQTTAFGSKNPEVFRTIFLPTGTAIQSRDLAGVVSSGRGGAALPLRAPAQLCVLNQFGESYSGTEMVDGHKAAKVTRGRDTSWHALEYGCAPVKHHTDWGNGSFNEKKLVALVKGEPDPALFHVVSAAKEVPPSQWHSPNGAPVPDSERDLMKKLDDNYRREKP